MSDIHLTGEAGAGRRVPAPFRPCSLGFGSVVGSSSPVSMLMFSDIDAARFTAAVTPAKVSLPVKPFKVIPAVRRCRLNWSFTDILICEPNVAYFL